MEVATVALKVFVISCCILSGIVTSFNLISYNMNAWKTCHMLRGFAIDGKSANEVLDDFSVRDLFDV